MVAYTSKDYSAAFGIITTGASWLINCRPSNTRVFQFTEFVRWGNHRVGGIIPEDSPPTTDDIVLKIFRAIVLVTKLDPEGPLKRLFEDIRGGIQRLDRPRLYLKKLVSYIAAKILFSDNLSTSSDLQIEDMDRTLDNPTPRKLFQTIFGSRAQRVCRVIYCACTPIIFFSAAYASLSYIELLKDKSSLAKEILKAYLHYLIDNEFADALKSMEYHVPGEAAAPGMTSLDAEDADGKKVELSVGKYTWLCTDLCMPSWVPAGLLFIITRALTGNSLNTGGNSRPLNRIEYLHSLMEHAVSNTTSLPFLGTLHTNAVKLNTFLRRWVTPLPSLTIFHHISAVEDAVKLIHESLPESDFLFWESFRLACKKVVDFTSLIETGPHHLAHWITRKTLYPDFLLEAPIVVCEHFHEHPLPHYLQNQVGLADGVRIMHNNPCPTPRPWVIRVVRFYHTCNFRAAQTEVTIQGSAEHVASRIYYLSGPIFTAIGAITSLLLYKRFSKNSPWIAAPVSVLIYIFQRSAKNEENYAVNALNPDSPNSDHDYKSITDSKWLPISFGFFFHGLLLQLKNT